MKGSVSLVATAVLIAFGSGGHVSAQAGVKYVKYESAGRTAWGILENDTTIRELTGSPISTKATRSEEHTSELQSRLHLVCRLLLEKKKTTSTHPPRASD